MRTRIDIIVFTLLTLVPVNLAAQNTYGEHRLSHKCQDRAEARAKNTIYVLDGKVITENEFRATSLWKIGASRSVRSKNDPLFRKYAKEDTDDVVVVSSADSAEESVLGKVRIDISNYPVALYDGVEVPTPGEDTSELMKDIAGSDFTSDTDILELFAPRTRMLLSWTTTSKSLLKEIIRTKKTDRLKSMVESSDKLAQEDKEYISEMLKDGDDISKWIVVLVDGMEYVEGRDPDLDLNDIESMKLVRDSSLCRLFAPRTGGILKIGTKSKTRLNELAQIALKTVRDNMERAHRTGEVYMR
ncbi:MAG: hypothetical protein ACI3Y2_07690 [Candidatus Egerieousia sp.]